MNKFIVASLLFVLTAGLVFTSCKNKNTSVVKVFVRSYNQELLKDAKVVIISQPDEDLGIPEYVDTLLTNSSGFALFIIDDFFEQYPKKADMVANFNIIVKKATKEGQGTIRARAHITAVETVTMEP